MAYASGRTWTSLMINTDATDWDSLQINSDTDDRERNSNNLQIGTDDELHTDCLIITDDNDVIRISTRLIENRCPALLTQMRLVERNGRLVNRTATPADILNVIFEFFKSDRIVADDWLLLEQTLDVANQWNLSEIQKAIVKKFLDGMNEENCIGVWRLCCKYIPDDANDAFEYVLYTINESVKSGRNLDFFHLKSQNLHEILSNDLLRVNEEMDVWILLRKWASIDRRRRLINNRNLLKCIRYNFLNEKQCEKIKKDLFRSKLSTGNDPSIQWSMASDARTPRDLLIAIGGWEKSGPTGCIEVYDSSKRTWKRAQALEDERHVAYHECIVIGTKLYVIGGFEGSHYFNTLRCYDGKTKSWSELAPMHHSRCYIAACDINGVIIVAGGSDGRSRLRTAEKYDAKRNQWTKIRNMTQRRSDAAACAMAGKMYVAGGYTGDTVLQSIEVYTVESDIWIEVAQMMSPRSGLSCASSDDEYILIVGGFDGNRRLQSVEMLRIGSAHTIAMEPMPTPRSNFAMCKMNGYFYVVGGYNNELTNSALRFDGKLWQPISDTVVGRSALRVVELRAWPDPKFVLDPVKLTSKSPEQTKFPAEVARGAQFLETSKTDVAAISKNVERVIAPFKSVGMTPSDSLSDVCNILASKSNNKKFNAIMSEMQKFFTEVTKYERKTANEITEQFIDGWAKTWLKTELKVKTEAIVELKKRRLDMDACMNSSNKHPDDVQKLERYQASKEKYEEQLKVVTDHLNQLSDHYKSTAKATKKLGTSLAWHYSKCSEAAAVACRSIKRK